MVSTSSLSAVSCKHGEKTPRRKRRPQDPSHMSVLISAEQPFFACPKGPKITSREKERTLFLSSNKPLT